MNIGLILNSQPYSTIAEVADHIGIWIVVIGGPLLFLKHYLQHKNDAKERRQENQITYSVNVYQKREDGRRLIFRTALDRKLKDLMPDNDHLTRKMILAARRVPIGKSFFCLDDRESHSDMMNALMNSFSEITAKEMLALHLVKGQQKRIVTVPIVAGVTSEKYPESKKVQKTRLMIVGRDELDSEDFGRSEKVEFERPHHSDRHTTMLEMRRLWQDEKLRKQYLTEWEIYLEVV